MWAEIAIILNLLHNFAWQQNYFTRNTNSSAKEQIGRLIGVFVLYGFVYLYLCIFVCVGVYYVLSDAHR